MSLPIDPNTGVLLVKDTAPGGGGGGGTQYTEGDVESAIVGTAILWEDTGNTLRVPSATKRLPVELPAGGGGLTDTELRASPVPVSGTFWQAIQPVSGPLTDTQLRATPVPVSGTVSTGGLTDTQLRASAVPVSGPLTDTQLRASAVPVSTGVVQVGDNASTLSVDDGGGSLTVDGTVTATGPLTDTQLRASAVPVSGPLTDTQLRASAVPVSGPLTDTQLRASAVPVSMATQTPDVTDRAAREVGRARIWDGTDEATVLPIRTQPATTEKALNMIELPSRLATYAVSTAEIAQAITIGVKEGLALWYTGGTKDIYIVEIWAAFIVTTASTATGRTTIRLSTITSAPTGGTALTPADVAGGGASAITNAMAAKTGGGAIGTTFIRTGVEHATQPLGASNKIPIFQASTVGNGLILRGGASSGFSIDTERVAAHTSLVDQWTYGARWIEL